MPRITPYTAQVDLVNPPEGRRAHASDFNAGPGNLGAGMLEAGELFAHRAAQDDIVDAHKSLAEARALWKIQLDDRAKHAESDLYQPTTESKQATMGVSGQVGADTQLGQTIAGVVNVTGTNTYGSGSSAPARLGYRDFSKQFSIDLADDLAKRREALNTAPGRRYFDTHAADLTADYTDRAFLAQADLAGKHAIIGYTQALNSNTSLLMNDPRQFDSILKESLAQIQSNTDIPAGARDKLVMKTQHDLAEAAVRGWIKADPDYAIRNKLGVGNPEVELPPGWDKYGAGPQTVEGMVAKGNIDLTARPQVRNADGSVSTVASMSFNDGKNEVLIPRVVRGRVVSEEEAIAHYKRSGEFLGKFSTPEAATAYAEDLHDQQEQMYAKGSEPNGPFDKYLSSDDKKILLGEAHTEITARNVEAERQRKLAKEAQQEKWAQIQDDFLAKHEKGELTAPMIVDSELPAFGEGSKHTFLRMLEEDSREGRTVKTNATVYRMLQGNILLPFGNPNKITNENELFPYYKDLTPSDFEGLRKMVRDQRDSSGDGSKLQQDKGDFLKMAYEQFRTKDLGMADPLANENYYKFSQALEDAIYAKEKAKEDPRVLFDPNSKEYFGNRIKQFKRPASQILDDVVNNAASGFSGNPYEAASQAERAKNALPAPRNPQSRKDGAVYDTGRMGVLEWDAKTQQWWPIGQRPIPNPREAR